MYTHVIDIDVGKKKDFISNPVHTYTYILLCLLLKCMDYLDF